MKIIHDTTVITRSGDAVRTLCNHSLAYERGRITTLGPAADFQPRITAGAYTEVIRGSGHVVIPGLVNTHHHLCQSLTRCLPAAQNERLFKWLLALYEIWRGLDHEALKLAAKVSIAELLLHGCTTTSDHHYMVPRGSNLKFEAVLEAAEELGIRIHLCRGAMTMGQSRGGLPPDDCVEDDEAVLADCQRVLDAYHDPSAYAMRRIDLAPCSPFNCTRELLRDTVTLARQRDRVLLHTHLAETLDEEEFCQKTYKCRPLQFLADLNFLGPDVYLAHCVCLNDDEIKLMAETHTGVSHNPSSNMRLGSGIAPIRKMLDAGVRVGLGVDGSSSNDGGNLLGEARQALLVARTRQAVEEATKPRSHGATKGEDTATLFPVAAAFELATVGGSSCLNRPVLGHLNPGAAADFAMFRTDDIALAGAYAQDPLAALMLCSAPRADRVFVGGREVVREGRIIALDEHNLAERMNGLVARRFR